MRQLDNSELAMVRGALDTLGTVLADKGHTWTDGERAIFEQAVELVKPDALRAEYLLRVEQELSERRNVGRMLCNCAFNYKQRADIPENDRNVFAELQARWDAIKTANDQALPPAAITKD